MVRNTRKRLTQQQVIERFIKVHGDKYNYSEVEYKNTRTKLKINCKKHGDFEQLYKVHASGSGCPKCANEKQLQKQNKKFKYSPNIWFGGVSECFSKLSIL